MAKKASSLINYLIYAVGGALGLGGGLYLYLKFKQMGGGTCLPDILTCTALDVTHGNAPLAGVVISVTGYGSITTGSNGVAKFCTIPSGTGVTVTGTKAGYQTFSQAITVNQVAQNQAVLMIV